MKKSLLLSLAAASSMMMAAQTTIVWDFSTHGIFKTWSDPEGGSFVEAETDIISSAGMDREGNALMDATKDVDNYPDDPYCMQHGLPNRIVSLFDALTYAVTEDPAWLNGTFDNPTEFIPGEETEPGVFEEDKIVSRGAEYAANLKSNPFIGWVERTYDPDNKMFGPCRMHWYRAKYGSLDAFKDGDYMAADEANWISDVGSLVWIKSKQGKKPLAGTYVQFPEVQGPFKVVYYAGSTEGSGSNIWTLAPVVNGAVVADKAQEVNETVAVKRYMKREFTYDGTDMAALRLTSGNCGVWLQRVEITPLGNSAIENIIADSDDNAPIYNVMGVQVDENYKGIVIKNGKKYIQK
ncbi:MAG: hypothetical protein NC411_03880 [Bacteroides sp.]|nr:hypothetical protein [Bacteroides sp.]